ncbi:MAG: hypothetical protein ABOK23_12265 [Candidatus Methanoperedens sp.]|nr:hypothetical protein [Candidatus Methanoperedens sp.]
MDIEVYSSGRHNAFFARRTLAEFTKILRDAAKHGDERFLDTVAELFKLNGEKRKEESLGSSFF